MTDLEEVKMEDMKDEQDYDEEDEGIAQVEYVDKADDFSQD